METKFKDIAHLYVGCEIMVTEYDEAWIETSCGIDLIAGPDGAINTKNGNGWDISGVRPILRAIKDISDEEKKAIYQLVFERPFPDTGQIVWRSDTSYNSNQRWVLCSGVDRLGIEVDGAIWADCDLHVKKYNQHEVTRMLLVWNFDLFGLIESGQAIDATTLPVNPYSK